MTNPPEPDHARLRLQRAAAVVADVPVEELPLDVTVPFLGGPYHGQVRRIARVDWPMTYIYPRRRSDGWEDREPARLASEPTWSRYAPRGSMVEPFPNPYMLWLPHPADEQVTP